MVTSGILGIFEEENNFEVSTGEYLLLHPDRLHGGTLDYRKDLSFFWLHFRVMIPEKIKTFPQYGALANREKTIELCRLFLNNQDEPGVPAENADLLLRLILNECGRSESVSGAVSYLAAQAREQIKRHCTEANFSAGELAAELNCNRDYLNRIFHRAFHQTISAAINQARMNHCCNLLLNSTLSIKEICYGSGYNDEAYFRRQFFRHFATNPRDYRKQHAREHTNAI